MSCDLYFFFSIICFLFYTSFATFRPRGVTLQNKNFYNPSQPFTCLDGSDSIPFHFINDDFCDCGDGSDEPGTSACANGIFSCLNHGHISVDLPSSRVNDGICDCCDSSDEYRSPTDCFNNCKELGAVAVASALAVKEQWTQGHEIRNNYIKIAAESKLQYQTQLSELLKQEQEALKAKNDMQDEKDFAEDNENKILAKVKVDRKGVAKQRQHLEQLFQRLDTDKDGRLTVVEVQSFDKFDYDGDGIVSEKEALFYLQRQEEMDLEAFVSSPNVQLAFTLFEVGGPLSDDSASEKQETTKSASIKTSSEKDDILKNAAEARKRYADADKLYRDIQVEIWRVRRKLREDWGPDDAYLALESQCYERVEKQYLFTLCPFDKCIMKHRASMQETLLGLWDDWSGETDKYSVMTFSRGAACSLGPNRATQIRVVCGGENRLLSAAESSPCSHVFEWATPAACDRLPDHVIEILAAHNSLIDPGWAESSCNTTYADS